MSSQIKVGSHLCRKLSYLNVPQMVRIMLHENIYLLEKWNLHFSTGMTFTYRNLTILNTCNTDEIWVSTQFSKYFLFIESIFLATHGHAWDSRQISVRSEQNQSCILKIKEILSSFDMLPGFCSLKHSR